MRAVTIARLWRGWTTAENADEYEQLGSGDILPRIRQMLGSGYHGAYLFRREVPDAFEFPTLLLFDSLDAVKELAGEDYEEAYVPPEAQRLLLRYDRRPPHHEVVIEPAERHV